MLVFLDFEASSLDKRSYPIEVAWVFEDGRSESYLIRPAPAWQDWDVEAEAIHHIPRSRIEAEGIPHEQVARRMIDVLDGHDLLASAPSWDGKWLSVLLRAAGLPRHSIRLRDTEAAERETAARILAGAVDPSELMPMVEDLMALTALRCRTPPRHRALADAKEARQRWLDLRAAADARAAALKMIGV